MYKLFVKLAQSVASLILLFTTLFSFTDSAKEIAEFRKTPLDLPQGFTVTAHSGAMYTIDNSVPSIRQIRESAVDIIEMDVTFRPDGTPVSLHNSEPGEKQGVMLYIMLKEIAVSDTLHINLDLKSSANLPAVQALVDQYGLSERVFYTGVGEGLCAKIQAETPRIPYYLNIGLDGKQNDRAQLEALAQKVKNLGALGLNISCTDASALLCDVMHENGLLVSVWTVNNTLDQYRMLSFGVDNITTKEPNKLLQIIREW